MDLKLSNNFENTMDLKNLDELPLKYISVNPLAAKGDEAACMICKGASTLLCTDCRTYYCTKEHLYQDDDSSHSAVCGLI